jgi:large subunit ribosomal protein L25
MNATNAKLETALSELRVSCKVKDIPDEVVVRLEAMEGETLTAGDIEIPSNTTLLTEPGEKVCVVTIAEEEDDDADAESEA